MAIMIKKANQARKPFTLGTDLQTLRKQLGRNREHAGRSAQIRTAIQGLKNPVAAAPTTPTLEPRPRPIVQPLNTSNVANAAPQPSVMGNPDNRGTLFPTERIFEPQNYQGSPLYQFQVKAGLDQLGKSLASRGLTNSGYGIRKELDVPMMAAAQDTDRMTRLASENADRLANIQQNESLRLERQGNNQWDRAYNIAELMSRQSPWQEAVAGLNNTADTTNAAAQSQANFLQNYYNRVAGGGGGGGAQPIPLPSGPNFSNITPAQIAGNASSNNGWMEILNGALASLFPKPVTQQQAG